MYSLFTNIYLLDGTKIFLLHRKSNKAIWPDSLLGIGGKIEPGEELFAAALREFNEEAGVNLLDLKLVGTLSWLDQTEHNGINYIFTATKFNGTLFSECNEGTFEWIDVCDALIDPRTAIHQLRYLPRLLSNDQFSLHLQFEDAFSDGKIIKEYSSDGYIVNRLSKSIKALSVSSPDHEVTALVSTILESEDIKVVSKEKCLTINISLVAGKERYASTSAFSKKKQTVKSATRAALEFVINSEFESRIILVPIIIIPSAQDVKSLLGIAWFNCNGKLYNLGSLTAEHKVNVFGLLITTLLSMATLQVSHSTSACVD